MEPHRSIRLPHRSRVFRVPISPLSYPPSYHIHSSKGTVAITPTQIACSNPIVIPPVKPSDMKSQIGYHILATVIVLIWGVTFVNSKQLLMAGMQAHEIFTLRFLFAYICIWTISPRRLWADSWRDELRMILLGLTGGSMYFVTENIAVAIDYVTNVAFIVCTAPLLTTIIALIFIRDVKATRRLIIGSVLATFGVGLVVFNGHFVLQLNPLGDALAISAALCWAIYSILLRDVTHYSATFVTRKVFFYGVVTVLPVYFFRPWKFPLEDLAKPIVAGNLIFLSIIASFGCFALWSLTSKKLGALKASNYIYLNPISTSIASALVLDEPMTCMAAMGCACILLGVYCANSKKKKQ